jgi:transposase
VRSQLTDESHVREVIHEFNQHGFESLRPRFRGRPRRISTDDEARIVAVAGARPDTLGCKAVAYLHGQGIEVSPAHLARILARAGLASNERGPGRPAPTESTRQRRRGSSRCTGNSRRTGS